MTPDEFQNWLEAFQEVNGIVDNVYMSTKLGTEKGYIFIETAVYNSEEADHLIQVLEQFKSIQITP